MPRLSLLLGLLLAACAGSRGVGPLGEEVDPGLVRPSATLYQAGLPAGMALAELEARDDAHAHNELGRRHGLGEGLTRDAARAKAHYQRAAEAGLAVAQCNLGYMHARGEGTPQDPALALHWLRRCAAQGHFAGASALGRIYLSGQYGMEIDGRRAEAWLLLAARQGYVEAQAALVTLYTEGRRGLSADPAKAVQWQHRVRDARLFGKVWKDLP